MGFDATSYLVGVGWHRAWVSLGCQIKCLNYDQRKHICSKGVAGLAAARYTQDLGWPTIVLEARDRLGGIKFLSISFIPKGTFHTLQCDSGSSPPRPPLPPFDVT